jgi:hypothetical protein
MSTDEPRISLLGTSALLFDAPGPTELDTQRRIWRWPRKPGNGLKFARPCRA